MNAEQAKTLIALIEAAPEQFVEVCASAEDPEAFQSEILDLLSELGADEAPAEEEEEVV